MSVILNNRYKKPLSKPGEFSSNQEVSSAGRDNSRDHYSWPEHNPCQYWQTM